MSNEQKKPGPALVDERGNAVSEEEISLNVLIDRCLKDGLPDLWKICSELHIDQAELRATIENVGKSQRFQPTRTQIGNIVSTIGWGIALGYAYAKKAKPIQLLH